MNTKADGRCQATFTEISRDAVERHFLKYGDIHLTTRCPACHKTVEVKRQAGYIVGSHR